MKLQIEKMVYGGAGLAHQTEGPDKGKTVFVPFALPNETVEATLKDEREGFGDATLVEILTSSTHRITPQCIHFGECGGCHYQHADYTAQVALKQQILEETLQRAGLNTLPEIQTHTAEPWHYRNRVRLRLEEIDGALRAGYNRRGTTEFLPIRECPILAPLLWQSAAALLQLASEDSSAGRWAQSAAEVELFTSQAQDKLQASFFVYKDRPGFAAFCERFKELVPELTGAGVGLLSTQRRRAQSTRRLAGWGSEGLSYRVANESYWVSRGGFFQVNRFLVDELVRIVTSERRGSLAWDLYAGVGLFSRVLAKEFTYVVAVEASAEDLMNSFKGPGKQAVEATTLDFLRNAVIQRDRPDLIVMDPPRAGVGAEACALLARLATAEIVYVSCDPVTLSRDLKILVDAGYQLKELHMIDLFPQTFHLETIAILRR